MKKYYIKIFWFVMPCRLANTFLRFGGTYYLLFQRQADPKDRSSRQSAWRNILEELDL
jgi:hypothetical protein